MQSTGGKVSIKGSSIAADGSTIKLNSGDSGTADDPNSYQAEKPDIPSVEADITAAARTSQAGTAPFGQFGSFN